ncbi:MAG TPA: SAM-dependent methyltransferase [Ilumatobacteraceae bacterium]|nr:SAM-dependent methyltransferase [Ilumatobacteraceae bacterium]
MDGERVELDPIGVVAGGRSEPIDDDWALVEADIVLDDRFPDDATAGLEGFSHIDVIFHFDRVDPDRIHVGARHPRNRSDWPAVGIFAQRAKARPNRLGLTTCELVAVDGRCLRVRGLDAIAGSPVLDIKPTMEEFLPRGELRQPAWSRELMSGYWHPAAPFGDG